MWYSCYNIPLIPTTNTHTFQDPTIFLESILYPMYMQKSAQLFKTVQRIEMGYEDLASYLSKKVMQSIKKTMNL